MATLSLRSILSLDSSKFESGIDRSRGKVGLIKKEFGALKNQIAAAFSVGFITRHTAAMIRNGAAVYDQAKRFNMSTDSVQKMTYALEQNGNTLEELAISYTALEKARERALNGDTKTQGQFAALGIGENDLRSLGTEGLFMKLSDNVKNFTGNVDELKTTLLATLGETGVRLLKSMREGITELQAQFVQMGGVIDRETIQKLKEADGKMLDMKMKLQPILADLGIFAANTLTAIQKGVQSVGLAGMAAYGKVTGDSATTEAAFTTLGEMWEKKKPKAVSNTVPQPAPIFSPAAALGGGAVTPTATAAALRMPSLISTDPHIGTGNFIGAQRAMKSVQDRMLRELQNMREILQQFQREGDV